jgi:hypothetical protein
MNLFGLFWFDIHENGVPSWLLLVALFFVAEENFSTRFVLNLSSAQLSRNPYLGDSFGTKILVSAETGAITFSHVCFFSNFGFGGSSDENQ